MTLDKDRLLVRYYLWTLRQTDKPWRVEDALENGTNLCAFVQRIVFVTLFIMAGTACTLLVLAGIATIIYNDPIGCLIVISAVVALTAIVVSAHFIIHKLRRREPRQSVALEYIKAMKRGVCPLIKFSGQ